MRHVDLGRFTPKPLSSETCTCYMHMYMFARCNRPKSPKYQETFLHACVHNYARQRCQRVRGRVTLASCMDCDWFLLVYVFACGLVFWISYEAALRKMNLRPFSATRRREALSTRNQRQCTSMQSATWTTTVSTSNPCDTGAPASAYCAVP